MIQKTDKGYKVDVRPAGSRGIRIRKTFKTRKEAVAYESWIRTQANQQEDWQPPSKDKRTLIDLIDEWYEAHGKNLKDGSRRKTKLQAMAKAMNNPLATKFKANQFTDYRSNRITNGTHPNTLNHELAYLKAVFNELKRAEKWQRKNPLQNTRKIKTDEPEMTYLTTEEIKELLEALKNRKSMDAYHVSLICLATGARWSEAETIRAEYIQPYKITFNATKKRQVQDDPNQQGSLQNNKNQREREIIQIMPRCVPHGHEGNQYKTTRWSNVPCTPTYLCQSFHNQWWQYTNLTNSSGSFKHNSNHALRSFIT